MNKKLIALLVAIATVNASMFAFIGDVVEGTFDTAGRVATAPVDAVTNGRTWDEKREARRQRREERQADREERRAEKAARERKYYRN